jgi:hypothetical protein
MSFGAPGYDAFKYIGEPGQWFDAVQFRALDERRNDRPMPSAAVISGEKGIFTGHRHCGVILPISGRKSSSITDGIHFMGVVSGVITVSDGLLVT